MGGVFSFLEVFWGIFLVFVFLEGIFFSAEVELWCGFGEDSRWFSGAGVVSEGVGMNYLGKFGC